MLPYLEQHQRGAKQSKYCLYTARPSSFIIALLPRHIHSSLPYFLPSLFGRVTTHPKSKEGANIFKSFLIDSCDGGEDEEDEAIETDDLAVAKKVFPHLMPADQMEMGRPRRQQD